MGEFLFPKGELIFVYPGIGHTNPLGLNEMISEVGVSLLEIEFELIIGIKNILINSMKIIKNKKENLKYLKIKSPRINYKINQNVNLF